MITKAQVTATRVWGWTGAPTGANPDPADEWGLAHGVARVPIFAPLINEFHYTGRHECSRTTGPRGGITEHVTRVRRSGKTQTWKTRPDEFRVPIKYGLYESGEITQANAADFHAAEDCPLNRER